MARIEELSDVRGGPPLKVTREEARRIAVRAQLLDGSATGVRETVQRLGFLQIDAISTVAPPQHLVLWSRLGSGYDRGELDRLLWEERTLFEWSAFIWPIEDLPIVRARMRAWPQGDSEWPVRARTWLRANASFRRYVLRELGRRGPLLSRELDDRSVAPWPVDRVDERAQRDADARVPRVARRRGDRRPARRPAALGARRGLVSRDGEDLASRGRPAARREALPRPRRRLRQGRVARPSGASPTARCRIA